MFKIFKILCLLLPLFFVFSCSSDEVAEEKRFSAEEYFEKAQTAMAEKNYESAVENFQEIERQYPFSPLATRAEVLSAYAHYKDEEYEDAIAVLERFTKLHPGSEDVAYAYYLRALCYYERISDVKRDQEITKKALDAMNEVVVRFPNTEYARDAKLKLDLSRDHLAGKEMEIGRFYQKRGQNVAAINRFKEVIKNYDTTSHVPEALYRLTEIYLTMGVVDEARKNAAVLGHNFPDSKWYEYAYRLAAGGADSPLPKKDTKGWFDGIIGGEEKPEVQEENEEISEPENNDDESEESWLDSINIFK